jgi:mercuric ion transport protein
MQLKPTLWASAVAAVGASLCCVAPLVLVSLGFGGAWLATLTQLEPYRPAFIGITLALLAWAGYTLYRQPALCIPGQPCANRTVRRRQRGIFWTVAAALLLLLTFPGYASLFY